MPLHLEPKHCAILMQTYKMLINLAQHRKFVFIFTKFPVEYPLKEFNSAECKFFLPGLNYNTTMNIIINIIVHFCSFK